MAKNKIKIAYIVTEIGCMNPHTGAYQHISIGIKELSRYFEVIPLLPSDKEVNKIKDQGIVKPYSKFNKTGAWGLLRDARDFYISSTNAWYIAKKAKQLDCSIAYVRVQQLNPISLFLKFFGLKVFLEANGLQFESRKKRFSSWAFWLHKPMERFIYQKSTHTFFVGSYGNFWNINEENWTNVENGIEEGHFSKRKEHHSKNKKLKIAIVANFVNHHNGELLIRSLNKIDKNLHKLFELELIGDGFGGFIKAIPKSIKYTDHGFISRKKIALVLSSIDIGLIPDAPNYQSQMKFFDYAASGCLVLAPDTFHLKKLYSDKGALFFKKESSSSLSKVITNLLLNKIDYQPLTKKLQEHVTQNYTWKKIFKKKADIIFNIIKANDD